MTYAAIALLGLAAGMTLHWLSLPLIGTILGAALGVAGTLYQVKLGWVLIDAMNTLVILDAAYFTGALIVSADWRTVLGR